MEPVILAVRPTPVGAGRTIAHFDVQLTGEVRMFNLKLVRGHRGYRIYAPSAYGSSVATFSPDLSEQLIGAVEAALGEKPANDRNRH